MIRIIPQNIAPPLIHRLFLAREAAQLFRCIVRTSRDRFPVQQGAIRCPDNRASRLAHLDAVVDIVERNGQIALIHATNLHPKALACQQASCGDRRDLPSFTQETIVLTGLRVQKMKAVPCNSPRPERNTAVLHVAIREKTAGCPQRQHLDHPAPEQDSKAIPAAMVRRHC